MALSHSVPDALPRERRDEERQERGKKMTVRPRENSEAMINRRTNPGYYRGIKSFSRCAFACSVRPQRLSRPFSSWPVFLLCSHPLSRILSFSHPLMALKEMGVFNRRSNVVKTASEKLSARTDRWSVGLIDVSVSDNLNKERDKRGSLISLVAAANKCVFHVCVCVTG